MKPIQLDQKVPKQNCHLPSTPLPGCAHSIAHLIIHNRPHLESHSARQACSRTRCYHQYTPLPCFALTIALLHHCKIPTARKLITQNSISDALICAAECLCPFNCSLHHYKLHTIRNFLTKRRIFDAFDTKLCLCRWHHFSSLHIS